MTSRKFRVWEICYSQEHLAKAATERAWLEYVQLCGQQLGLLLDKRSGYCVSVYHTVL